MLFFRQLLKNLPVSILIYYVKVFIRLQLITQSIQHRSANGPPVFLLFKRKAFIGGNPIKPGIQLAVSGNYRAPSIL